MQLVRRFLCMVLSVQLTGCAACHCPPPCLAHCPTMRHLCHSPSPPAGQAAAAAQLRPGWHRCTDQGGGGQAHHLYVRRRHLRLSRCAAPPCEMLDHPGIPIRQLHKHNGYWCWLLRGERAGTPVWAVGLAASPWHAAGRPPGSDASLARRAAPVQASPTFGRPALGCTTGWRSMGCPTPTPCLRSTSSGATPGPFTRWQRWDAGALARWHSAACWVVEGARDAAARNAGHPQQCSATGRWLAVPARQQCRSPCLATGAVPGHLPGHPHPLLHAPAARQGPAAALLHSGKPAS